MVVFQATLVAAQLGFQTINRTLEGVIHVTRTAFGLRVQTRGQMHRDITDEFMAVFGKSHVRINRMLGILSDRRN